MVHLLPKSTSFADKLLSFCQVGWWAPSLPYHAANHSCSNSSLFGYGTRKPSSRMKPAHGFHLQPGQRRFSPGKDDQQRSNLSVCFLEQMFSFWLVIYVLRKIKMDTEFPKQAFFGGWGWVGGLQNSLSISNRISKLVQHILTFLWFIWINIRLLNNLPSFGAGSKNKPTCK